MRETGVDAHIGGRVIIRLPSHFHANEKGTGYCGMCGSPLKYLGRFIVDIAKLRYFYKCTNMKCQRKFEFRHKLNIHDNLKEEFIFR